MFKSKKLFLIMVIFFFVGGLVFAGGLKRRIILNRSDGPKPYAEGEVLVKFKKGVDLAAVNSFAASQSLNLKKRFDFLSKVKGQECAVLSSPGNADPLVLVNALKNSPNVEFVSPNYRRELAATPNDTDFSSLWGMHNTGQTIGGVAGTEDADIDAPEAWNISTGSSGVIVAVVDTGLDYNHPDLAANCWVNPNEIAGNGVDDDGNGYVDDVHGMDSAGVDGTASDGDPMDGYGHGTHCSGTIGAVGNNSLGVVGVNWNVKIMGLKFFYDSGDGGYDADAIECIQYAVDQKQNHGQNVAAINASWGGTGGSDSGLLRDAIEVAINAGIVFCAAAGNGGTDGVGDDNDATPHYPSSYTLDGIIAVAATDNTDTITDFSNFGLTSVDLSAPGASILSTVPGKYIPQTGDIFFDNMENGTGNWLTGGTNNSWAITTNIETYWGSPYPTAPSPPRFWSDRPAGYYLSNTNSTLTYNIDIDLSGYAGQNVYFGIGSGRHVGRGDHFYVEISNNSGSSWTVIQDWSNDGYLWYWSSYLWLIPESFKTTHFRMRFHLVSGAANNGVGWVIDNIGIGTTITYGYESWDGTSMACPHVAGAVGLMASVFGSETVAQRKARILNWGDHNASLVDKTVTCKRLNVYRSLYNPSVTVTSPNGGESWMVTTTRAITWTSIGEVNNVDIHYSLDNGVSWNLIVSNTTNTGSYAWTIPSVSTPRTTAWCGCRRPAARLL